MATIQEIKELALCAAKRNAPANYSIDSVDKALREELGGMAKSINEFNKNKYDIFEIIIETADEIVPKNVIDRIGMFAEVQVVPQGQRAIFKNKKGRMRAKKFLTQVGLSGVYETFRLDSDTFTVNMGAVGGAGTIDFERFLDGTENMSDIMEIVTEGLEDAVYYQTMAALKAAYNAQGRPAANQYYDNGFDPEHMFKLITTVKAYGEGVNIFATPAFIGAMGPDCIVPGGANFQGIYHQDDIDAIHNTGRIRIFRGTPVVEIPQSYIDENNDKVTFDDRYAFVLPTGGEKVVKVVLEGQTQMWDYINKDQSIEINTYKKMGLGVMTHHNWGIYVNAALEDNSYKQYGYNF